MAVTIGWSLTNEAWGRCFPAHALSHASGIVEIGRDVPDAVGGVLLDVTIVDGQLATAAPRRFVSLKVLGAADPPRQRLNVLILQWINLPEALFWRNIPRFCWRPLVGLLERPWTKLAKGKLNLPLPLFCPLWRPLIEQ
jgi:hypothetical protein